MTFSIFSEGEPPKGTRWSLFRDHIGDYMHRWILKTPWGTLRLHHILRSDADRHMHDHPFDFTSFLLTGGYYEKTSPVTAKQAAEAPPHLLRSYRMEPTTKYWPIFSIVRKRAEDRHLLTLTEPVWTLVVSGPKRREWGFDTEIGWVHHREYLKFFPTKAESTRGVDD